MYRVKTYNQISPRGLQRFDGGFEVGSDADDPHAILLRSHKLTENELSPNLRAIARAGAGVNNVPVDRCTERGVVVFNTPGANANSVKELVLAALLLSSRDVLGGMRYVETLTEIADADTLNRLVEAEKKRFKGRELYGRTLGVVGLGAIGSLVARAALDLGMDVIGFDPALSVEAAWRLPSEVQRMENLPSLFARSDYVTFHVPSLVSTRGLVNTESLQYFKPGTVLLNYARHDIVDEAAIATALEQGTLAAYFSDFPSPVLNSGAVHATPHLGASTAEAEENCAVMAADQLLDFLNFGNINNSVNFPALSLEPTEGFRLAVTNKNVAGMLGQLMSILADRNINVIDMINKSREEVAYNLIDVAAEPTPILLEEINAIDSVMNVRLFEI